MSFVAFAATVGGGSALLGGAMIGAGIGGAYSAITGDGDILNSMLTGGLIGGAGAGGLSAMGVGAGGATSVGVGAGTGAGAGATGVATKSGVAATQAAMGLGGPAAGIAVPAAVPAAASTFGAMTAAPAAGATLTPAASSILGPTAAKLTGNQMLGYGLAGTSALSLLGDQNRTSAGGGREEDEYTKRLKGYKLSSDYQPYRAPQPNPYYRPTYAADGGVMNSYDDETGIDMAGGGIAGLGGYSDGGRMLKGPGDGMSDSIPGIIGGKQPARLADGEFVVPADVVSHLGNGSTDAGAKRLYSMMDDIRKARTGRKKQAPEINVDKYLPGNKKASGGIAGYAEGGITGYNTGGEVSYNEQLAANIQAAYDQGYSGSQIGAALIASGVSPETAAAATGLDAGTISQVYAGGADLTAGGGGIGNAAGNPKNPNPPPAPYTPGVVAPKPVVPKPPVIPKQTYTTQQYLDFLKASMAAGNSLEVAKQYIRDTYGATDADLYAMADLYNAQNKPTTTPESTATTGPVAGSNVYRPTFVPRTSGINMSDAIKDPYSNAGLESLYRQMMGQYEKPAAPKSDTQVRELVQKYVGNGAEVGRQLINAGIPVNQAISALKSYSGITPEIVNQAYIGGESLGTAPPPTLNTQYNYSDPATYYRPPSENNLILTRPIVDAAFTPPAPNPDPAAEADEAAGPFVGSGDQGARAGGLMSINRKKQAKTKPRKGLLAA
jgi:hypothetical protein